MNPDKDSQQEVFEHASEQATRWKGISSRLEDDDSFEVPELSGPAYRNSDTEREAAMRAAAWSQIEKLMNPERSDWNSERLARNVLKVGPEVEYQVYVETEDGLQMADQETKSRITDRAPDVTDTEVGALAIEGHAAPRSINDLDTLTRIIRDSEEKMLTAAAEENAGLLRLGAIPFDFDQLERTDEEKYEVVPAFHNNFEEARGTIAKNGVEIEDASLAGGIFSSQLNLRVPSPDAAVSMMNQSYAWQPYAVRLAANSRFFKGEDLGVPESRNDIWNVTHDADFIEGEEYIGELGSYVDDLSDYFERTLNRPMIMNTEDHEEGAREIAEGIYWKDTRIKLDEDEEELIVEFRAPPIQTTALEDVAVQAFTTGRSLYGWFWGEKLPDIDLVNQNRRLAYHGSDNMYDSDGDLRNIGFLVQDEDVSELEKAVIGLEMASVDHSIKMSTRELYEMGYDNHDIEEIKRMDSYLDILANRVQPDEYGDYARSSVNVPSDELAALAEDEGLESALRDIGAFQKF